MALPPESRFKNKVLPLLRRTFKGSWWHKVEAGAVGGIPDIIGCINGKFVALELKTDVGRATELQMWTLENIRAAGGFAEILRPSNIDLILAKLKDL